MRRLLLLVGMLLAGFAVGGPAASAATDGASSCRSMVVPVTHGLQSLTISGELCLPAGAPPATVQVLVHGGTYNKSYWHTTFDGGRYSYVDAALAAGYATFSYDRIGSGDSSRPLAVAITAEGQAADLHHVITFLRDGAAGPRFQNAVAIGHSLGSVTAVLEAAAYHDVQAVVLTGFSHQVSARKIVQSLTTQFHLASLDPKFAGQLSALGYLTSVPGKRQELFSAGDIAADLAAYDEAHKDMFSAGEVPEDLLGVFSAASRKIDVPTLLVVGSQDRIFCDDALLGRNCSDRATFLNAERPYFAPAACVQAQVLPGAGHLLNYTRQTEQYRSSVLHWLDSLGNEFTCDSASAS